MLKYKLPSPWRITFDTNPDDCNLHCLMCEEHSTYRKTSPRNPRRMPLGMISSVINNLATHGLQEVIPSTMGEPLIYPHFEEFLELLKANNLKLNLTTNGTFPRLGVKGWARLILPLASDIKISINGATKYIAEKIMQGIDFEKQLMNITEMIKIRNELKSRGQSNATITFQVTYMEENLEELPELLKLAIDMGIDRLKGHHLWITWPELERQSLRRNDDAIARWNNKVDVLKKIAQENPINSNKRISLDNVYKLTNSGKNTLLPHDWICPFLGREAWIAWDGTFNVCCSPDELRKTLGSFGNIKDDDFIGLWNSSQYQKLLSNWGNYKVCQECNMRKPIKDILVYEND